MSTIFQWRLKKWEELGYFFLSVGAGCCPAVVAIVACCRSKNIEGNLVPETPDWITRTLWDSGDFNSSSFLRSRSCRSIFYRALILCCLSRGEASQPDLASRSQTRSRTRRSVVDCPDNVENVLTRNVAHDQIEIFSVSFVKQIFAECLL